MRWRSVTGINQKTVAKWKKRTAVQDLATSSKYPHSTVLTVEQKAVIVAFRRHTLLQLAGSRLIGDDGSGEGNGGHEGMRASIVADVDTPPVLETTEHDLDLVAAAIERGVVRDLDLAIGFLRDTVGDASFGECLAQPVGA